jgi:hypothetical protein
MEISHMDVAHTRRTFITNLGGTTAAIALGSCAQPAAGVTSEPGPARGVSGQWDLGWIDRIRRARYRAVFDAPNGDTFLQLAARYLDNVREVYGAQTPEVAAVVNVRTRAVAHALNDATWKQYPIGEDANVRENDAVARRNINYAVVPGMSDLMAGITYERLLPRGMIVVVCDFALSHLATRLAPKAGVDRDTMHQRLRAGLVPGAYLVPSGIFGMAEAQNAGCSFVPA